jgi:hypothetical protein
MHREPCAARDGDHRHEQPGWPRTSGRTLRPRLAPTDCDVGHGIPGDLVHVCRAFERTSGCGKPGHGRRVGRKEGLDEIQFLVEFGESARAHMKIKNGGIVVAFTVLVEMT